MASYFEFSFYSACISGNAFKEALWNMARATTEPQFEKCKLEMAKLDEGAVKWLEARDPSCWCRAFFDTETKCDMLLNNVCETFNSCILDGRELGIICMLDWVMEYVMIKLRKNRGMCADRWRNILCPKIIHIVDDYMSQTIGLVPLKAGKQVWMVVSKTGDKYI